MIKVSRCLIDEKRKQCNISRKDLAKRLGISVQRLSDYANNRYIMGVELCKNATEILGCNSIDELFEWKHQSGNDE